MPESRLVLGKHSGRHALKARCEELGLSLDREELDVLYAKFSALADRKKGILDDEIRELAGASRKPLRSMFCRYNYVISNTIK